MAPRKQKSAVADTTFKPTTAGIVNQTYLKKSPGASTISDATVQRANVDLTTLRTYATDKETIKHYIEYSPDLSLEYLQRA